MSRFLILFVSFLCIVTVNAQSPRGAWTGYHISESGTQLKSVVIFSDGYQAISIYDSETGAFVSTNGGTWELNGNTMTEKVEFDSDDPDRVGKEVSFDVILTDSTISIVGSGRVLRRIDNGTPGVLQGAWLMSGRVKDGVTQQRDTTRTRKTMKILSGTRFQWIAYNTETKEFKGTGGGSYMTKDGEYTEMIEFFSKDDTRVGMDLSFNYSLLNGDWNHTGFSSKGSPIHEIWSIRK